MTKTLEGQGTLPNELLSAATMMEMQRFERRTRAMHYITVEKSDGRLLEAI